MAIKTVIDAGRVKAPDQVVSPIDRVRRQEPVVEGAGVDLPVAPTPVPAVSDSPLARSLANQGFDVTPQTLSQEPTTELNFAETLAPTQPLPADVQAQAELQREQERIPPLSERIDTKGVDYLTQTATPAAATLDRASRVTKVLDADSAGPTIPTTLQSKTAFHGGDYDTAFKGGELSTSRLVFDPDILGAGEFDENNQQRVNPMFGAVMGMVAENYFRNSGVLDGEPIENNEFDPADVDEDQVTKKAKQNSALGNQVWQEWKREQAGLQGLPSDELILSSPKPSQEQLSAIGALAKESYALANPDIVERIPGGRDEQVLFQLRPGAVDTLEKGYRALSAPFASHEIPPSRVISQTGQPAYEAGLRAKKQTTRTGIRDAGKRIAEAKQTYHEMPRLENANRELMLYSQAIPALMLGVEGVSAAVEKDIYGANSFNVDNLPEDNLQSQIFKVGSDRARGLVKQKANNILLLERAISEEQAKDKPNPARLDSLTAQLEEAKKFSPANTFKADALKLLETMNTAAKYGGQILHNTYGTQMLTGRLQVQQNKWNPQSNTHLRYITGSPNLVRVVPNGNGFAEQNFRELSAVHFIKGGSDLKPDARRAAFQAWRAGRPFAVRGEEFAGKVTWEDAVKAGEDIKAIFYGQAGSDALPAVRETLQNLQAGNQIPLGESLTPLQQIPNLPTLQPATIQLLERVAGKKKGEIPYLMENLAAIADYNKGRPFRTALEGEVDGITHGISSNAMALGIEQMALRSGTLNPDEMRKLYEEGKTPGDLRDAMKDYMQTTAQDYASTFAAGRNLTDEAAVEGLTKIALNAVEDRDNYLKKSPMTLGYGQEIGSLKQHIDATMATGDRAQAITELIDAYGLDTAVVRDYLHGLLVNSLTEELHPRVIETGKLLRANNILATLTDLPLYYDNGMGFRSNIVAMQDDPGARQTTAIHVKDESGDSRKLATEIYGEYAAGSAERQYQEGGPAIPGGYGHGRSIPTMAQTYDATMISGVASGRKGADLKARVKSRGYEYSWQPIMDAAKADLSQLDVIRQGLNEEWWKGIKENDYVGQIMGAGGWYDQTVREFLQEVKELPPGRPVEIGPNTKWRGIYYVLNDFKGAMNLVRSTTDLDQEQVFETVKGINDRLKSHAGIRPRLGQDKPPIVQLTPAQLTAVVQEWMETLKVRNRNLSLAADVKRDREALFKKIREDDILQVDF